ncbi:MAG TPA: CBS domain-containing protein [Acidobacteriota bacterium]|nr:CBS domain-containing protein [Acidobacteriota bacterium]
MLVKTLLDRKPRKIITIGAIAAIDEAMDLLISNRIGCLPVVDNEGKLVGIISDKDIFKKVYETKGDYHSLKVGDVMTADLIIGLLEDEITYIAGIMDKNWIRHVPIVEGERLVGLVSLGDIIQVQTEATEVENRYLQMYMDSLHRRDMSGD